MRRGLNSPSGVLIRNEHMAAKRKSWREKLDDDKDLPKVVKFTGHLAATLGPGTMVIPAPREVDALIRRVRKGRVTTIGTLRRELARQHGTTIACPLTTGIFSWIAAHAAVGDEAAGKKRITPWWRVLKEGNKLNPKYPGGLAGQARRLRAEGHVIKHGQVVT